MGDQDRAVRVIATAVEGWVAAEQALTYLWEVRARLTLRLPSHAPLPVDRSYLVVDETGVGRSVVDMFKQAGQHPTLVTITAL